MRSTPVRSIDGVAGLKAPPQGTPSTTSRKASASRKPHNAGTDARRAAVAARRALDASDQRQRGAQIVCTAQAQLLAGNDRDRCRYLVDGLRLARGRDLHGVANGLGVNRLSRKRAGHASKCANSGNTNQLHA